MPINRQSLMEWWDSPGGHKTERVLRCFLGSWIALAIVASLSRAPWFRSVLAPLIIGAYGAEVVVLFANPKNPFAQPRSALIGNTLSAIVSVAIQKAFKKTDSYAIGTPDGDAWAAGATSVALAFLVMEILNVTSPPGGAIALLGTTESAVVNLGWYYVPIIIIATIVMLAFAFVVNNIGRSSYPDFWFSPHTYQEEKVDADVKQHQEERHKHHKHNLQSFRGPSAA